MMIDAARRVERAGADFLLICTNTMHLMASEVQDGVRSLFSISSTSRPRRSRPALSRRWDCSAPASPWSRISTRERLRQKHGLEVIVPEENDREVIHAILYNELCLGEIEGESKRAFQEIIARLEARGAQGIILGCTEIPLIVNQKDYDIPLFDTTTLHAEAAVDFALA